MASEQADAENADDLALIAQAETLAREECQYAEAARLLRQVVNQSLLGPRHRRIINTQLDAMALDSSLTVDKSWQKQGESHSAYDFIIHYQVSHNYQLTLKIEIVLESSLLVPILSIFNESQLYSSWMPSWKHPRVGFRRSEKLAELGRGNQIILVTVDMPFPLKTRECVQYAAAIDAIDGSGAILIKIHDVKPGEEFDGTVIPEPEKGVVRIDFDCGMVIQSCPEDHPALQNSIKEYKEDEDKLLLTITQRVDPHVSLVPVSLVNFFTRLVIKQMVVKLLETADEVRSGKRVEHEEAISQKPELYQWINERVEYMLQKTRSDTGSQNL